MQSFFKSTKLDAHPSGLWNSPVSDPVLTLDGSESDLDSRRSILGSRCSLNFGKKFCIKGLAQTSRSIQGLLTLIVGSPCFFCRKVGMCTGHFCDFPMLYCTPGLYIMSSGSISEGKLSLGRFSPSRIMLIRCSRHSTLDICCGIDRPLVRSDRVLDVQCSSSLWCPSQQ